MKRLIKADLNIDELIKKIDKDKLIKAAEEQYLSSAESFSENYSDDNLIDWDYCQPKGDISELFEEDLEKYMDDFEDGRVYDYICEATEQYDLTDEQLGKIMKYFGCNNIKEFIIENGYTDKAGKYFSKMEDDMIEYLRENYPDECRDADRRKYEDYRADEEYDDRW